MGRGYVTEITRTPCVVPWHLPLALSTNTQLPDRKTEVTRITRKMRDGIGGQLNDKILVACELIGAENDTELAGTRPL